jgi:phosphatidylglycerophosphate synthase
METTNLVVIAYYIYIPIAIALTFFVARNLFKNGLVYMMDIFNGRQEIAVSTNQLFKTGFYLLNIGFALWILEIYHIDNTQELIEELAQKIGGFSVYLGVVLFLNLFMFFRGKKAAKENRARREQQQTQQSMPHV